MAQHGPSVTLSLTLPITCHICLGKVTTPPLPGPRGQGLGAGQGGARGGSSRAPPRLDALTPTAVVSFKALRLHAGKEIGVWGVAGSG